MARISRPGELEVWQLFIKGLTSPDICALLGICLGTVKIHIRNIPAKLPVNDRTVAASESYRRRFWSIEILL